MNWLKKDALNRAWRTILQTVALVVVAPAADAALQVGQRAFVDAMAGQPMDWSRVGQTALYAAGSGVMLSLIAFVHRLKVDKTRFPSGRPSFPPYEGDK